MLDSMAAEDGCWIVAWWLEQHAAGDGSYLNMLVADYCQLEGCSWIVASNFVDKNKYKLLSRVVLSVWVQVKKGVVLEHTVEPSLCCEPNSTKHQLFRGWL